MAFFSDSGSNTGFFFTVKLGSATLVSPVYTNDENREDAHPWIAAVTSFAWTMPF